MPPKPPSQQQSYHFQKESIITTIPFITRWTMDPTSHNISRTTVLKRKVDTDVTSLVPETNIDTVCISMAHDRLFHAFGLVVFIPKPRDHEFFKRSDLLPKILVQHRPSFRTVLPVATVGDASLLHFSSQEFFHLHTINVEVAIIGEVNDQGLPSVAFLRLPNFDRILTFPFQIARTRTIPNWWFQHAAPKERRVEEVRLPCS